MLAEETRHDAVPALEVVLADGHAWGLALPSPKRYPIVIHERDALGRAYVRVEVGTRIDYRLQIRRLATSLLATDWQSSEEEQSETFRRFVIALLRTAHDIDQSQAEALLDPRRVDLGRIALVLIPAVFGQGDLSRSDGR